ncbi:T9SS type A sorting domain-containing protein [Pedobacter nanyangensis]|uniref:T9SS type A sorting domain-containing protein n=1 Tax=Pedobacter nanyangensis TaxID=1562389 RepID=UPI000DE3DB7F|nr:T9SS type A sorting domain-containing protein [Pedobacter nanyangensis]
MKRTLLLLFFLMSVKSYGQFFSQDFQSSTDKSTYLHASSHLFDWLSSFANSPSSIETEGPNNFLRFSKTGASSSIITKRTDLNASTTKNVAVIKFRLRISAPDIEEPTPPNNIATLYLGGGSPLPAAFDNDNVSAVPDANMFSSLLLRVQKVSAAQYRFFISSTTTYFEDWQDILYIANKSGASITYKNPLGANATLATGRQDIWIGTTKVISGGTISANYQQTTYNQFKVVIPSNYANVKFDIDDINIYDNVSVLPVNLISFTGKKLGSSALLNWQTASENNNAHFNLLRVGANGKFEKIGEVKGRQNTSAFTNYTFTDFNPLAGNVYYQLQQVDLDGTIHTYENLVVLTFNQQPIQLSVSPASNHSVNVLISGSKAGKAKLTISDTNGKIISSKWLWLTAGNNDTDVPAPRSKGIYIATLQSATGKTNTKFAY